MRDLLSLDDMTLPTTLATKGRKAPSAPAIQSGHLEIEGYEAWLVVFAALLLLHAVCYVIIKKGLSKSGIFGQLKTDPKLAAHFIPQLAGFCLSASLGLTDWLYNMPAAVSTSISSYVPQGERMACVMIAFQLYELLACIVSRCAPRTAPSHRATRASRLTPHAHRLACRARSGFAGRSTSCSCTT